MFDGGFKIWELWYSHWIRDVLDCTILCGLIGCWNKLRPRSRKQNIAVFYWRPLYNLTIFHFLIGYVRWTQHNMMLHQSNPNKQFRDGWFSNLYLQLVTCTSLQYPQKCLRWIKFESIYKNFSQNLVSVIRLFAFLCKINTSVWGHGTKLGKIRQHK